MTAQEREVMRLLCESLLEMQWDVTARLGCEGISRSNVVKLRAFAESEQPAKELPSVEEIARQMALAIQADTSTRQGWACPTDELVNMPEMRVCATEARRMMEGLK